MQNLQHQKKPDQNWGLSVLSKLASLARIMGYLARNNPSTQFI